MDAPKWVALLSVDIYKTTPKWRAQKWRAPNLHAPKPSHQSSMDRDRSFTYLGSLDISLNNTIHSFNDILPV
jgi:hypothetical protein